MKKHLFAIGLAVMLGGVSTVTFAADSQTGNFYVGANVGQAQYRVGVIPGEKVDLEDTASAVRLGYVWHWNVDFAVEGGYVNLGTLTDDYHNEDVVIHEKVKTSGPFAGAAMKYHVSDAWYLSARAGLFQSNVKIRNRSEAPSIVANDRSSTSSSSWYAGAGVGYDVTPKFGLGLNYDNYHGKVTEDSTETFNVAMFSLSAEYRF